MSCCMHHCSNLARVSSNNPCKQADSSRSPDAEQSLTAWQMQLGHLEEKKKKRHFYRKTCFSPFFLRLRQHFDNYMLIKVGVHSQPFHYVCQHLWVATGSQQPDHVRTIWQRLQRWPPPPLGCLQSAEDQAHAAHCTEGWRTFAPTQTPNTAGMRVDRAGQSCTFNKHSTWHVVYV